MHKMTWMMALILTVFLTPLALAQTDNADAAKTAASEWLSAMDNGDTAATWESAGTLFKAAVTQDAWAQAANATRNPLGAIASRTEVAVTEASSLPGVPDGSYVVIQYATDFANKADSVETLSLMLDADGAWKVVGYFVK